MITHNAERQTKVERMHAVRDAMHASKDQDERRYLADEFERMMCDLEEYYAPEPPKLHLHISPEGLVELDENRMPLDRSSEEIKCADCQNPTYWTRGQRCATCEELHDLSKEIKKREAARPVKQDSLLKRWVDWLADDEDHSIMIMATILGGMIGVIILAFIFA